MIGVMVLVAAGRAAEDARMAERVLKRLEVVFTYASTPEAYEAYGATNVA